MSASVILGHPNPQSFNHAIARTVVQTLRENGHPVSVHDLYAESFDPLLQQDEIAAESPGDALIVQHCAEIARAEGIIIIHPNWWGQPPAILKGWVDRVLRAGVAFRFLEGDGGEGVPEGLLRARAALVFNTANTPRERELRVFGDPLETLWKNCILNLCGVSTFHRRMFEVIVTSTPAQRAAWLDEVRQTVGRFFPPEGRLPPP